MAGWFSDWNREQRVPWMHRPHGDDNPRQRDEHRRLRVPLLHEPCERDDSCKRDEHRKVRVLGVHEPYKPRLRRHERRMGKNRQRQSVLFVRQNNNRKRRQDLDFGLAPTQCFPAIRQALVAGMQRKPRQRRPRTGAAILSDGAVSAIDVSGGVFSSLFL